MVGAAEEVVPLEVRSLVGFLPELGVRPGQRSPDELRLALPEEVRRGGLR